MTLYRLTFDKVSRLEQDTSTVLAAFREWLNSFISITRAPEDTLSPIPTYLPSQKDCLQASFVCRHWRRTFLGRAELWSGLFLSKGEGYVKTFLVRAKGAALHPFVGYNIPATTMVILSSRTEQIQSLDFHNCDWRDIRNFSEANPGPLPLLHTLKIRVCGSDGLDDSDGTSPSPPLLSNAVNLKSLLLRSYSQRTSFLSHFVFPNLVSLDLSVSSPERFRASRLPDFLGASPTLRTIQVSITAGISLEGIPQQRVVILPNVEFFILTVDDGGPGYKVAVHISCPSAKRTLLTQEKKHLHIETVPEEVFPTSVSWNAIVHQYAGSPVKGVGFTIKTLPVITCTLAFRSLDGTIIQLCFQVAVMFHGDDEEANDDEWDAPSEELFNVVFAQAIRTIRYHLQLPSIKRVSFLHGFLYVDNTQILLMENEIRQLFKSVGPLDGVTLHLDLRQCLYPFLNSPERQ